MSGTVFINGNSTWMPSGGTVDSIRELCAARLQPSDDEWIVALLDPARGYGWATWDLRELDAAQWKLLSQTIAQVFEVEALQGRLGKPLLHQGTYAHELSWFKALLLHDARSGDDLHLQGRIAISDVNEWLAPGWIYDLVLEHWSAQISLDELPLSRALLDARTRNSDADFDLTKLDARTFCALVAIIISEALGYRISHGACTYFEAAALALYEPLLELKQRLQNDERNAPARLLLRDGVEWSAPGWIYDSVLSEFTFHNFRITDEPLCDELCRCLVSQGGGFCDLRRFNVPKLQELTSQNHSLRRALSQESGEPFRREIQTALNELQSLLDGL